MSGTNLSVAAMPRPRPTTARFGREDAWKKHIWRLAVLVAFIAMCVHLIGFNTDWRRMGTWSETISTFVSFLPDLSFLPELAYPMFETLVMALWGTVLGVIISLPIAYLSASNVTPNVYLTYPLGRGLIVLFRSTHEIIFALIFVAALGLGPLAGIFALAARCVGFMSKTTAEAIENVRRGPIEALAATGAHPLMQFQYAVVPQILPIFLGNAIFQLDINVRRAAILGMVGAGGIGLTFSQQMQNFNYANAGACILAIIIIVIIGEVASTRIRTKIFTGQ